MEFAGRRSPKLPPLPFLSLGGWRGEFNRQDWLGTRICETASVLAAQVPESHPSCADEAPYKRDGMPQGKGEGERGAPHSSDLANPHNSTLIACSFSHWSQTHWHGPENPHPSLKACMNQADAQEAQNARKSNVRGSKEHELTGEHLTCLIKECDFQAGGATRVLNPGSWNHNKHVAGGLYHAMSVLGRDAGSWSECAASLTRFPLTWVLMIDDDDTCKTVVQSNMNVRREKMPRCVQALRA